MKHSSLPNLYVFKLLRRVELVGPWILVQKSFRSNLNIMINYQYVSVYLLHSDWTPNKVSFLQFFFVVTVGILYRSLSLFLLYLEVSQNAFPFERFAACDRDRICH